VSPARRSEWDALRRAFHLPGSRRRAARDVDRELRFHLEERIEEMVAAGLDRATAEARARLAFGDVERWRRETRHIDEHMIEERRRMDLFDALRRESRLAIRALARERTFALVAILTLGLGLGATAAIFTLLDAVVLRPLPYPRAEQLVSISHPVQGPGGVNGEWGTSPSGYFLFKHRSRTLSSIGAYMTVRTNVLADGRSERAQVAVATSTLFGTLGLRPALGRTFTAAEDAVRLPTVAVIGHGFWQRHFGADSSVIGRTLDVEGQRLTIVGVMAPDAVLPTPSAFAETSSRQRVDADVWMPAGMDSTRQENSHPWTTIARMRPGVTPDDVQRELAPLVARFSELFPQAYDSRFMTQFHFGLAVRSERDQVIGGTATVLWTLFGAVACVLLIACANVANLFLVRIETRRRETAIRTALGAERAHLAWHFLSESLIVSVAAGALAVALAWGALRALVALAPSDIPRLDEVSLGWRGIGFAFGLALLTGIVFGLVPIARRSGVASFLGEGGRSATSSRRRRAARDTLVVVQVALALVLLVGAGLLLRSVLRLRDVRPGFDPREAIAIDLAIPRRVGERYADYEGVAAFHRRLLARVSALPGVASVGVGTALPLEGFGGCSSVFARDHWPLRSGQEVPCAPIAKVSPGYLRTLGVRVTGREPGWSDIDARSGAVVITRALADRVWPGEDPIGKMLNPNGGPGMPYYAVVGVAEGLRANGLDAPPTEAVFYPLVPQAGGSLWDPARVATLVVRTRGVRAQSIVAAVRRTVDELDPAVAIGDVRSLEDVVAHSMARVSFVMLLLATAGALALVLSVVGIYGVISYLVSQRRAEIGIRMALGARVSQVSGLVVMDSLRLAGIGVAIGLVGALAATRVLGALLYGVSPTDPVTLGAVTALLVALAALASFAPARRAARVDPVEALRSE
jgi:predicted permease